MDDQTNRVVEHLFKLDSPTGVTNVKNFCELSTQRLAEVRVLCQDQKAKSLWSRTYGSYPGKPTIGHLRRTHLVRAVQVVKSVMLALTVDGLVPESCFVDWERKPAYVQWVFGLACLDIRDLMLSWVKETTAYVACVAFGQSETNLVSCQKVVSAAGAWAPGTPGILGPGAIRRACQFLMAPRVGSAPFVQRVRRLAENVLYIKRSCPPMLPHMIEKQLEGHAARVCRSVAESGRTDSDRRIRSLTKAAIRGICLRLFDGKDFDPTEVFPSMSASFEKKRSEGGAFGDLVSKHRDSLRVSPSSSLGFPMLHSMVEPRPGVTDEIRVRPSDVARLEQFSDSVGRAAAAMSGSRVRAKPAAICEPCKVRVVTIAEAEPYQRAACVQSWLWKVLSQCPTFQYTGRPIGEEWDREFDLNRVDNQRRYDVGWRFISGDYSAATDNLDPELTEFVWETVASLTWLLEPDGRVPLSLTKWAPLVRNSLVGHVLHYPSGAVKEQTWGQLMGSPVSFPILNIVNAAATAVAMFLYEGAADAYPMDDLAGLVALLPCGEATTEYSEDFVMERQVWRLLRDYHVRTNGDDLFFYCPPACSPDEGGADESVVDPYDLWKEVVSKAGLEPSLGKNYSARDFAVMNSEMRQVLWCEGPMNQGDLIRPRTWRYEAFANLPLIMGMEAKGPDAGLSVLDKLCWWELAPRQAKLLRGLDQTDARFGSRIAAFERWHAPVLARVPPGVDYYIPLSLGGVGLAQATARTTPLGPRERAAWLACLDPIKRAMALSFPGQDPETLWGTVVKNASRPYLRYKRVRSCDRADGLPSPVEKWGTRSHGSATFAQALSDADMILDLLPPGWENCDNMSAEPSVFFTTGFQSFYQFVEGRSDRREGATSVRQRRERQARDKIRVQCKKARASGLTPMSQEGIQQWIAPYEVVEEEFSPTLRVYAAL